MRKEKSSVYVYFYNDTEAQNQFNLLQFEIENKVKLLLGFNPVIYK